MISNKKAQASQDNGRSSKGPTSVLGKSRVRLNALGDGIFAKKELVIRSAGEDPKAFEILRSELVDHFQSPNIVKQMFVHEASVAFWKLQRVHRCEAAEIRKQRDTARYRKRYEDLAEVKVLSARFLRDHCRGLFSIPSEQSELDALNRSLEETRRELQHRSLGLEYLIERLEAIKADLERDGYIPPPACAMLIDVCGFQDHRCRSCLAINPLAMQEVEKARKSRKDKMKEGEKESAEPNFANEPKQILLLILDDMIREVKLQKTVIERLEQEEEEAYLASLVLLPAERQDRIQRAEAAAARSFYKALHYLLLLEGDIHR